MALAWTLKPLGYLVARNHFHATPEPPALELPSAEFLEHDMLLNELYVSLAAAAKQKKLPFDRWPFRWLASDSARLPWTEFDREANSPASRLICPDATLELLQAQRRVFIELETGTPDAERELCQIHGSAIHRRPLLAIRPATCRRAGPCRR